MEITLQIKDVGEVASALQAIPGATRFALQQAILHCLRRGRTAIKKEVQKRYNAPATWVLRAIGSPHLSGLTGSLQVSGTRAPLGMFPMRDIYPEGVAVLEVKGKFPTHLLHAFARSGKVFERETPATKRYPIRGMVGLSVPAMAAERKTVWPEIERSLDVDLSTELHRLVRVILSGGLNFS